MALSKIIENSLADEAVSSAKLKDFSAAVDLNGVELVLDADADTSITADTDDRIDFKIAGVEHFSFSNSSGDTIIKPMVDAKDIKFQQYDGRTLLDINDGGFVGIANGATGPGEIRFFEDTDNGSNYVGLAAGTISSSLTFTLPTADGSAGQILKTNGSGALSFATGIAADNLSAGDAAVTLSTVAGNITIDATANDTDIIFKGTDNTADITMLTLDGSDAGHATFNNAITSGAVITSGAGLVIADAGNIGSASDTDAIAIASDGKVTFTQDIILKDGVNIGSASDTNAIGISSGGVVSITATTANTGASDGALTVAGGVGIAADLSVGDDLRLISDSAVMSFGANSEITLTHSHDAGLNLKHTATADDKPIILTLQTGETDLAANDVIGKIAFQAPDEGTGTDAILVSAAIQAVSESDFSASANATRLEFMTGASEAAAAKMVIASDGDVGIGDTSPDAPLHVHRAGSNGAVTEMVRLSTAAQNDNSGIKVDFRTAHTNGIIEFLDGSGSFDGNFVFKTGTGSALATPAERLRITPNGLAIGGTGAANTLEDYEEGTFTPTFSSSGGAYSISHSGQQGKYTKIGQTVICHFLCSASGTPSGGSGDFRLTGLPFTPADTSTIPGGHGIVGIINNTNINVDAVQLMFNLGSADTFANLMFITDSSSVTSSSNAPNTIIHANGPRIDGTLVYRTAS